ncbi:reverse transcriptase domain-containing protein [Tanacetum coccineum]
MFLGHVVSTKGIKAYPEKAEAVIKLQSPRTVKETLKRCMKKSDFQWTLEAERAIQDMKKCIAELLMVTAPKPKEELIMYLCVNREAVSVVLLAKRDSQQMSVYFVSRALQKPEVNYNPMRRERHSTDRNEEVNGNQNQGKTIYPNQRCLTQKSFLEPWLRPIPGRTRKGEIPDHSLDCQEKSYLIMENSSGITHSKTSAKNSISSKGMPLLRCAKVNQAENDEGLLLNLDILEKRREKVVVRKARSKAKMEKYYNAKVRSLTFRPGDFVYRSNEANRAKKTESWVQNGKGHTK